MRNPGGRVRFDCRGSLSPNSRLDVSFDVDLPTEIDDEYWENEHEPEQAFKQPIGKPSVLSYFVSIIKLIQILAVALRTIVSRSLTMFYRVLKFAVVFNQQIENLPRVRRTSLGTANCGRT